MDMTGIFFGVLFTAAGLMFALGKLHMHIAAWQSMPDDEKAQIKIIPLCRNIGAVIALCGVVFLLKGFIPAFTDKLFVGTMIAWLIAAGIDVRYISKSGRYVKK